MNILITANSGYLPAAKAMLYSLREHTKGPIDVYLLYDTMQEEECLELKRYLKDKCSISLVTYQADVEFLKQLKYQNHFSPVIFYRLIAQEFLPDTVERILYLDVDLMIYGSIETFYNSDFGDNWILACENQGDNLKHKKRLNLKESSCYINAGVILFNLKAVKENIKKQDVFQCIKRNVEIIELYDQDILNILYEGKIGLCSKEIYNYQVSTLPGTKVKEEQILSLPRVIHFAGSLKPWMRGYMGGFRKEYIHLLWRCGEWKKALWIGAYNRVRFLYWILRRK